MLVKVLTERPMVVLPSISDQCWLSVGLAWGNGQGIKLVPKLYHSPICRPLRPSGSFQGKRSGQQATGLPVGPVQHTAPCLRHMLR